MFWPLHHKAEANYWLKVFAFYASTEASIQLVFFVVLNNFGGNRISIIEFHVVMLAFQCLLIWPIWWVARAVREQQIAIQMIINVGFYVVYTYCWFGPVQDAIGYVYNNLQELTRPVYDRQVPYLDRGYEYSYLNYQMLKHAFRLSWFYLAAYFYNYRQEEKKRTELAVANKDLQLKMLKWHLNPSFYFKTINHLQQVAQQSPVNTTGPILQLAKVMEYVIYETKEKLISVKKEIQFITNYIQLINKQSNKSSFQIEVRGEHERLKISPLLLAGIIDKLTAANTESRMEYKMLLQFDGSEMNIKIKGIQHKNLLLSNDEDALHRRLTELYPGRFSINHSLDTTTISILLDEER